MRQLRVALESERARLFVGRERELALFRAWLGNAHAQSGVVSIYGVARIGKSTLLSEMLRLAATNGALVWRVDGRACNSSPAGFLEYLETRVVTSESSVVDLRRASRSFLGRGERPEAAAARLYLSRATYYRHVRRALERLAASLPLG